MLTLEHALRRSIVTLGLLAAAGTAAAQGTPPADTSNEACPTARCPEGTPTTPPPTAEAAPVQTDVDVDVEAQPPPAPETAYTTPVYPAPVEEYEEDTLEAYGIAVALGGGVEGFTEDVMDDTTDIGGAWNVRATVGTRWPLAFEGSYIGSAQSIEALGLDDDAILVGNGVQGALRVNLLDMNIQPFAFGGAAWRHYDITNEDFNTSAVSDDDDVFELPLGVGVAWKYQGFMLDARGEYRFSWGGDLVPDFDDPENLIEGEGAGMDRWGVNANVGYAF